MSHPSQEAVLPEDVVAAIRVYGCERWNGASVQDAAPHYDALCAAILRYGDATRRDERAVLPEDVLCAIDTFGRYVMQCGKCPEEDELPAMLSRDALYATIQHYGNARVLLASQGGYAAGYRDAVEAAQGACRKVEALAHVIDHHGAIAREVAAAIAALPVPPVPHVGTEEEAARLFLTARPCPTCKRTHTIILALRKYADRIFPHGIPMREQLAIDAIAAEAASPSGERERDAYLAAKSKDGGGA